MPPVDFKATAAEVEKAIGRPPTRQEVLSYLMYPKVFTDFVAYTEKYESRVDQVGTMKTPYGEFPVLRVATDLTRTSGFTTLLTKRTFSWVAECFGPVATAASQDFANGAEFTDNAEIRRIAP